MSKNSYLYYLALVGIALAVPAFLTHPPGESHPPATPEVAHAAPPPAAVVTASPVDERLGTVETDEYRAVVSQLNSGIKSFTLKDPQFRYNGKPKDVVTTDKAPFYPLAPRVEGTKLDGASWTLEQVSERAVRLHTQQDGVAITRKLEAGTGPYQVWITTTLRNTGTGPRKLRVVETTHHYVERHAESGGVPLLPARSAAISRGLCHHAGSLEHADRS